MQRVTEQAAQAEVQPGPSSSRCCPPGRRHVASGAARLKVRPAHQGILGKTVRPCVGDEGVESAATASVAGGAPDPVRKMFSETGSVGSEREGDDSSARSRLSMPMWQVGQRSTSRRTCSTGGCPTRRHLRRRPGSGPETALAGHARALAGRGPPRARAQTGTRRLPREMRAVRGDAGVPVLYRTRVHSSQGQKKAHIGPRHQATSVKPITATSRTTIAAWNAARVDAVRVPAAVKRMTARHQHAGCRVEKVTNQRRARGEPRNDPGRMNAHSKRTKKVRAGANDMPRETRLPDRRTSDQRLPFRVQKGKKRQGREEEPGKMNPPTGAE